MNDTLSLFITHLFDLANEASPWLLLGLLIAGLMKAWLNQDSLSKHLGSGKLAIVKAAFVGAPLPLCSCGVIPVATQLSRNGASPSATASFLVATPETGVDSVSVSYALLGPVMAVYRPIAAISSAIITGLMVLTVRQKNKTIAAQSSCCGSNKQAAEKNTCCDSKNMQPSALQKTMTGVQYALSKLLDDLVRWLGIGLLFAATIRTFVPAEFLLQYGSGLVAMLVMIAISIPMYICATASTPIAAGFILAGISPGTALVFMMAGPATNISTLGVIRNELGTNTLIRYLIGVAGSAIGFGLLLDWGLSFLSIDIASQMAHSHEILPYWLSVTCTALLAFMAIKPLRRSILGK